MKLVSLLFVLSSKYICKHSQILSYPIPINLLDMMQSEDATDYFESQLPSFDVILTFISFNKI